MAIHKFCDTYIVILNTYGTQLEYVLGQIFGYKGPSEILPMVGVAVDFQNGCHL